MMSQLDIQINWIDSTLSEGDDVHILLI